jgi:hypothetical protein
MTSVRFTLAPVGETMFSLAYGLHVELRSRELAAPHTPLHTLAHR